jgi:hypothetical protein
MPCVACCCGLALPDQQGLGAAAWARVHDLQPCLVLEGRLALVVGPSLKEHLREGEVTA